MNIASVAISGSIREYDKQYHYFIPENLVEKVKPGIRVIVPFGNSNRSIEAFVFSVFEDKKASGLKEIKKIIDEQPVLGRDMIKLAIWMKNRYICTYSDAIKCMIPAGVGVKSIKIVKLIRSDRKTLKTTARTILDILSQQDSECEYDKLKQLTGSNSFSRQLKALEDAGMVSVYEEFSTNVSEKTVKVAYIARPREEIIEEIESNRISKIQHIRVLEMLVDNEYISVPDIIRFSSVSASVLNTLNKYGYIEYKDIEVMRDPLMGRSFKETKPLNLTLQQSMVMEKVTEALEGDAFSEYLLRGVTGSGKTEVYLQLIQHCLKKGKTAIVLVPEISLTPQMIERFKGRFGKKVAVLHSRLSLGERYDQWRLIKDGSIKVTIGARSAVFAPFENLGIIILDEEHENTYKSEMTPKYHARDIARERCKYHDAVLLCGSATPSVETYYRAKEGLISYTEISERANNLLLPEIQLVDMREELEGGNRTIFSRILCEEIKKNKLNGYQSILFLNRRGYSSFVLCRSCGYTLKCVSCNISLTYHSHDERLICHYCGYTIKNPKNCPKCKSNYIKHFGTGTQKVEEEILHRFPGCSAIRMDMDTTSYKNSHEDILRSFRDDKIDIMIGTQMIAKGHDFPNVTLVGVLAADSILNMDDYRASERTFQLITQVAGRAGRGEVPGKVIIQTYNTEDFSILAACSHDYTGFYKQEIKIREKLLYPPFTNIATVFLSGTNDRLVNANANETAGFLRKESERLKMDMNILGPIRAPISRIKNKFRWRIVIKCKSEEALISVLTDLSDKFHREKGKSNVDLSVDINPVNML